MTRLEVVLGSIIRTRVLLGSIIRTRALLGSIIRTRALLGSNTQINPDRNHPDIIWMLSVVDPNRFLIKAGIRSRECIRTLGEVTMASMTLGPSMLTLARDPSSTLAQGSHTLTGQSILTPGRYLTSIATGVQLHLVSRATLATHTLTLR